MMGGMRAIDPQFVTLTLNPAWDCTLRVAETLTVGQVHGVVEEVVTAGGKGINVAKMLLVNDRPVLAAGILGDTDRGRFDADLAALGMTPCFMTVPGAVRTNLMITGADGEMKVNRPGFPELVFDEARLTAYLRELVTDDRVLILSGSLPVRYPADTYHRLIGLIRRWGGTSVLDAAGEALIQGVAGGPDVVKPNRQELEHWVGRSLATDAEMARTIRRLSLRYAALIVSDGPRGAWFAAAGELWRGNSPDVTVIDTTGAGDSMLGQFCADFFPHRQLTETVAARALAAGAAAVEQPGTPILSRSRVLALAQQVHVTKVGQ